MKWSFLAVALVVGIGGRCEALTNKVLIIGIDGTIARHRRGHNAYRHKSARWPGILPRAVPPSLIPV